MTLAIRPLDPADDATIDEVLRLQTAARIADLPDFPLPCRVRFLGLLRHPLRSTRNEYRVARLDGEVAGVLRIELPLKDNLENADIDITVHPEHRRRGVGRALHAYTLDLLTGMGRKRIGGMSPERGPGSEFARATGAQAALVDIHRRLDLSTVEDDTGALAAAWSKADGYEIVRWTSRIPDRYAADQAALDSSFYAETPLGDLALEPEKFDIERVREQEEFMDVCGIRRYHTGALHRSTGRLVALTAVGITASNDWHGNQWITLVDPAHRGHRLGMVVKLENLRYCREAEPGLRVIDTWNAAVNEHMIAINEAMGFRVTGTWISWQQEF